MVESRHSRELEFNERYYVCRGSEGFYANFSIIAKYNKSISKQLLSNALKGFIRKNTWLALNFIKTDNNVIDRQVAYKNWNRTFMNRIKFDDAVSYRNIDHFDDSIIEYMNDIVVSNYQPHIPLWQLVVFETANGDQYIGAAFDHSSFDGLSGVEFHKDLIKELDNAQEDEFQDVIFDYKRDYEYLPATIQPPVETLTDLFIPSVWDYIKFYVSKYASTLSKFISYLYQSVTISKPLKPNFGINPLYSWKPLEKDLKSKFKYFTFSPEQINKISKYTKAKGITVTPYLHTIALKCLQDTVFKHIDPTTQFSTLTGIAVNGRRYYSEDIKNFKYGSMVCGDPIYMAPIVGDDLLPYMKYSFETMQEHLSTKESFKPIGFYNIIDCFNFFNDRIGQKVKQTLGVSNLGRVTTDANCSFDIEEVYFGSNTALTYHFLINAVTTAKGLIVVFPYAPEYDEIYQDEKKVIDIFADKFYRTILDYAS
ncbi:alcohol acetyltransferase [Scheffersomyces coipomensis]|uniref:alcohol acetyltransferase n=1 Tax=Scheffersomyces coipomensis TaxID=1788519 RepID=UPI00315D6E3B